MNGAPVIPLLWLACTKSDPSDTDPAETDVEGPSIVLVGSSAEPTSWDPWFLEFGTVTRAAWDDASVAPPADALVVLLPDLPREASAETSRWVEPGGPVLGMGVGGARAFDGLDVGLGASDGGQGAVDGLAVEDREHAVFAGITVPDDGVVTIYGSAVADVGIQPSAGVVVLGWDRRYPGAYADLCYHDRYWFWGWGAAGDGDPEALTADGDAVLGAVVEGLLP